jgi:histidinol-phosphate aminotransferase
VAEHRPKILFLTSPNNPDGSMIKESELLELLDLPVLVVLDEAYIEFSDEPSRITWVQKYPNLVVLRTFSKCAALAGLRIGYGAFPLDMIEYLWRAKQPYNVSVAAEVAGCAALEARGYLDTVREALVAERQRLVALLGEVPYLEPYPSAANFILCKVSGYSSSPLHDYALGFCQAPSHQWACRIDTCCAAPAHPRPCRSCCMHLRRPCATAPSI